jgi:uncharacterized protein
MRVILDTNVFISSILGGRLHGIIDDWKAGKFSLIVSEAIAHEYLDVLNRPKFKISAKEIIATTDYLLNTAEFVTPEETILAIHSDPSDDKFLEAAVAGNVICIVSGDGHLLDIGKYREIPIITAHAFITQLKNS